MQTLPFTISHDDLIVLAGAGTPSNLGIACPVFVTSIFVGVPMTPVGVTANGGTPPYTYSAAGLPLGITMSPSGVISGTASTAGVRSYAITVTDAAFIEITQTCSITVLATTLATTCLVLSPTVGQTLVPQNMIATGGVAPYTFQAFGLPPGLGLSAGGLLAGTPTTAGNYAYTVEVTDSLNTSIFQDCGMTVSGQPPTPTPPTPQNNLCRAEAMTTLVFRSSVKPQVCND